MTQIDDVNKIIIVGNDVEKSGDDGIVVNTEEKENRREEEVFRVSVIPQQKPSYDDNGKKLYIKIADNEVIKSGDEGIEVNLKRDGNKGNEFFSFEHHDNHIEIDLTLKRRVKSFWTRPKLIPAV